METTLNITKQDLNAGTITEEHELFFGHVFRGKSAYQYAIENGLFSGTEEEYAEYLSNIKNVTDAANEATASANRASDLAMQEAQNASDAARNAEHATEQAMDATANANEAAQRANKEVENLRDEADKSVVEAKPITYSDLYALRKEGELKPGAFYRITDYQTMTSQENTRSAGHQFDIIVQALDKHTLSEKAHAIQHDGDTYFSNSNLSLWRLKYTLDNNGIWKWAVADTLEQAQEWKSDWGILESKLNAEASTNYEEVEVGGQTKYLYAPANRDNYWEALVDTLFREEKVGEVSSPWQLSYNGYNTPYEEGNDEEGHYWYWDDVDSIEVYVNSHLVATLYHDASGVFYDDKDPEHEYPISFDPNPNYEDTEDGAIFLYTPSSGAEAWFENVIGGKVDIVDKIYYDGLTDSLFYVFDSPLPQTSINIKNVYSKKDGCIYQSDEYLGNVSYTPYVPYVNNGGKGVIYEMVDENENCIQFDFKNIQFYDQITDKWYYTFGETVDNSLLMSSTVHHNVFMVEPKIINGEKTLYLFPIILLGNDTFKNFISISTPSSGMIIHTGKSKIFNRNYAYVVVLNGRVVFEKQVLMSTFYGSWDDVTFNAVVRSRVVGSQYSGTFSDMLDSNLTLQNTTTLNCPINGVEMIGCGELSVVNKDGNALPLYYSKINFGTLGSKVKIVYDNKNTIDSKNPLSSLNVCIPNSGDTEHVVDISDFPLSSPYTLHIATNSSGVVKQWCDADLIQ